MKIINSRAFFGQFLADSVDSGYVVSYLGWWNHSASCTLLLRASATIHHQNWGHHFYRCPAPGCCCFFFHHMVNRPSMPLLYITNPLKMISDCIKCCCLVSGSKLRGANVQQRKTHRQQSTRFYLLRLQPSVFTAPCMPTGKPLRATTNHKLEMTVAEKRHQLSSSIPPLSLAVGKCNKSETITCSNDTFTTNKMAVQKKKQIKNKQLLMNNETYWHTHLSCRRQQQEDPDGVDTIYTLVSKWTSAWKLPLLVGFETNTTC